MFHSQIGLQHTTNLAQVHSKSNKSRSKKIKAYIKNSNDQNDLVLTAIMRRLEVLREDIEYQILNVNENIKMAKEHQKEMYQKFLHSTKKSKKRKRTHQNRDDL